MKKSNKTTYAGFGAILAVIAGAVQTGLTMGWENIQWSVVIPAIMSGVGLLFSRDHNVSSKAAGVEK